MPLIEPLSAIVVMLAPEQIVCKDGVATALGVELTSTVAELEQLLVVGVMINVTYTGVVELFVKAPLILPAPLFAIPVTAAALFLVQL